MNRLAFSFALALAPILAVAYYYAAKVLMSYCDAAKYLRDGGSISTSKLDVYHAVLACASFVGLISAFILAVELAKLVKRDGR